MPNETTGPWIHLSEVPWGDGWADVYVCLKPAPGPNPNLGLGPDGNSTATPAPPPPPPARREDEILLEATALFLEGKEDAATAASLRATKPLSSSERWWAFAALIEASTHVGHRNLMVRLRDRRNYEAAETLIYLLGSRETVEDFLDRSARKQGVTRKP